MDERDAILLLGLLPSRRKRPSNRSTAERRYELPSSDADCHSPRPQWDHARCYKGKIITLQSAGL
jgi:hypothetical protein